jgi:hypothetical protein
MPRALFGTFLFALVSCSSDPVGIACPEGMEPDARGLCVPTGTDTGRGGRSDVGTDDTTPPPDTTPDTPDVTETPDVDLPSTCIPFERRCISATTAVECVETADGWREAPCGEGTECDEGACVQPPDRCTPGASLGCATPSQVNVCGDDGLPRIEACPAATPTCVDGECTDQVCVPNQRTCRGTEVFECAADGRTESMVQICEFGCSVGRCADPCAGDSKDYLGCDFWAVDLDNLADDDTPAPIAIALSNATRSPVNVTVTSGAGDTLHEVEVAAGSLTTVQVGPGLSQDSSLTRDTYRISSDAPITAHQFNPLNNVGVFSNDASLLMPATSLGREYVVIGWPSVVASQNRAYVAIVAVAEGVTDVTVTSPLPTMAGSGVTALSPGSPQNFSLEQGQVLTLMTSDTSPVGLTGMEIDATQNVAVFSGNECANVPTNVAYCDHIEQQLYPVNTWGTSFVGAKFRPRGTEPDVWRIVAAENGTNVFTNPVIPIVHGRTLGRGEYIEFTTDINFTLSADRPISLAQFMVGSSYPGPDGGCDSSGLNDITWGCDIPRTCSSGSGIGDPAFLVNVPSAQFRQDYIFLTPAEYERDYVTVVARPGTTLTLDGNPVTASGETVGDWEVIYLEMEPGVHALNGNQPFGLYAYGYDCDVSYAYPGGLNLSAL